jgi:hypothetical protein
MIGMDGLPRLAVVCWEGEVEVGVERGRNDVDV